MIDAIDIVFGAIFLSLLLNGGSMLVLIVLSIIGIVKGFVT